MRVSRGVWLFVVLSALLLALVGIAAFKDTSNRAYLTIQEQYKKDYGGTFSLQVRELFPTFPEATVGGAFRTERCISCHVPDIATVGPERAAQRLRSALTQILTTADGMSGPRPARRES